jgi:hypothetical protein
LGLRKSIIPELHRRISRGLQLQTSIGNPIQLVSWFTWDGFCIQRKLYNRYNCVYNDNHGERYRAVQLVNEKYLSIDDSTQGLV